jgi:hypothetical protein
VRRSPWAPRCQVRACSEGRNRSRQPTSAASARPTSPACGRPAWTARTWTTRPAAATSGARQARLRVQATSSRRGAAAAVGGQGGAAGAPQAAGDLGRHHRHRCGRGWWGRGTPDGVPRWVQGGPAAAQQLGRLVVVGVQEPLELLGGQGADRQAAPSARLRLEQTMSQSFRRQATTPTPAIPACGCLATAALHDLTSVGPSGRGHARTPDVGHWTPGRSDARTGHWTPGRSDARTGHWTRVAWTGTCRHWTLGPNTGRRTLAEEADR